MIASVSTVAYLGLEPRAVEVQCNLVAGLPAFVVVGTQDPYRREHNIGENYSVGAVGGVIGA